MKHGIMISHKHSFYDYGIKMVERKIGQPQKDDHTERVPYSNITYDFDLINGKSSYGERTISYKFITIACPIVFLQAFKKILF